MWRFWLLAGCGSESVIGPTREHAVLVDGAPGSIVLYREIDQAWQLAPAVGDRFGFDLAEDSYAVALIDPANRRVEMVFTTLAEDRDIRWAGVESFDLPSHLISGSVTGLDSEGFVTTAAGSELLQENGEFEIVAPQGSAPIVFAELAEGFSIHSLVVRRDVPVVADLEMLIDFADALPTSRMEISVPPAACFQDTTFSFGGTQTILSITRGLVRVPHPAQQLAGDRLTIELFCDDGDTFRTVTHEVPTTSLVPLGLDFPTKLDGAVSTLVEGRYLLEWSPYFLPVQQYEAAFTPTACAGACPRWSARISAAWVERFDSKLLFLSPVDLEELGLLDPRLEMPADVSWEVSAVQLDEHTRTVTGRRGVSTP